MDLTRLIDAYIDDQRATGRFTSERTAYAYRRILYMHADDAGNRAVQFIGKEDIRTTLRRWENPNTQRTNHAILASFYTWCIEEGHRTNSPAAQVRRAKPRQKRQPIPTDAEVTAMRAAAWPNRRLRWAIETLVWTGLRKEELQRLTGRAYRRDGFIHIEHGKGGKERWIPIQREYEETANQIRRLVADHEYVVPSRRCCRPPTHPEGSAYREVPAEPISPSALRELVRRVAADAGVPPTIGPHAIRRAALTRIQRQYGAVVAQAIGGHSSIDTTMKHYVSPLTPDELTKLVGRPSDPTTTMHAMSRTKAPTGIEPVLTAPPVNPRLDVYPQEAGPHDA